MPHKPTVTDDLRTASPVRPSSSAQANVLQPYPSHHPMHSPERRSQDHISTLTIPTGDMTGPMPNGGPSKLELPDERQ